MCKRVRSLRYYQHRQKELEQTYAGKEMPPEIKKEYFECQQGIVKCKNGHFDISIGADNSWEQRIKKDGLIKGIYKV